MPLPRHDVFEFALVFEMLDHSICILEMTTTYSILNNHISICPWLNSFSPTLHITPNLLEPISKNLIVYFLPKFIFCFWHSIDVCIGNKIFIKCVHSTYLWTMPYSHMIFSSCNPSLPKTLGSCTTSKLMDCSLCLNEFGYLFLV